MLEHRLKQVTGIDQMLHRYISKSIQDIPDYPEVCLQNIRGIIDRALDLIWEAELGSGRDTIGLVQLLGTEVGRKYRPVEPIISPSARTPDSISSIIDRHPGLGREGHEGHEKYLRSCECIARVWRLRPAPGGNHSAYRCGGSCCHYVYRTGCVLDRGIGEVITEGISVSEMVLLSLVDDATRLRLI